MAYLKNAPRRSLMEVLAAAALMLGTAGLAVYARHHTSDPSLLLAIKLLPLFPVALLAWTMWRLYHNMDELQRQTLLKMAALAAMVTTIVFMAWPSLRALGAPPLSPPGVILILAGSYVLCGAVISFLGFKMESGARRGIVRMLPFLAMLILLMALFIILHVFWQPSPLLRSAVFLAGMPFIYAIYKALQRRVEP